MPGPRKNSSGGATAALFLAGGLLAATPIVGEYIRHTHSQHAEAKAVNGAEGLPPYSSVSAIGHVAMLAMRNTFSADETFTTNINGITYAWPIGRPHRSLYKIALPCDVGNHNPPCHGDPIKDAGYEPGSNYAMDFVYRDAGKTNAAREAGKSKEQDAMAGETVRAITDGTILTVKPNPADPAECSQIQFQSIDGFKYFYGHLSSAGTASAGQKVSAGQPIAIVGPANCGEGVAHLHLDRGKKEVVNGQTTYHNGGSASSRDPQFIPLITEIFSDIPN